MTTDKRTPEDVRKHPIPGDTWRDYKDGLWTVVYANKGYVLATRGDDYMVRTKVWTYGEFSAYPPDLFTPAPAPVPAAAPTAAPAECPDCAELRKSLADAMAQLSEAKLALTNAHERESHRESNAHLREALRSANRWLDDHGAPKSYVDPETLVESPPTLAWRLAMYHAYMTDRQTWMNEAFKENVRERDALRAEVIRLRGGADPKEGGK